MSNLKEHLKTASFIAVSLFTAWALMGGEASASERITQSNDQNLQSTGDVSVGAGDAIGLGIPGLGDVDIGDCVVTKQTSIVLVAWQRYEENPWCQAMTAIKLQQYDLAERILCRDTNIGTYYDTEGECRNNIDLTPKEEIVVIVTEEAPMMAEHIEEEEEHDTRLDQLEAKIAADEERQKASQRAYERSKLERQQYAQQTLDALKEYAQ